MSYRYNFKCVICDNSLSIQIFPFEMLYVIDCERCITTHVMNGVNLYKYHIRHRGYYISFLMEEDRIEVHDYYASMGDNPLIIIEGLVPLKEIIDKLDRLKVFI